MMAELLFGNVGCSINTYVRNDNSDAVYHTDSMNTVTNEKRLNGFLESNREELLLNPWLGVGYIPGELNTSDSMTKSMSSVNLRSLLAENTFQIVTEQMKNQIRKKLPAAKHYIVYPDTTQGQRALNEEIRRKTRLSVL